MPKRGENIRKRKDGRWEGRYICGYDPDTGKSKYRSVYGKTYKDVKEKMDKAKYKTSQGIAYCTPSRIHFGKCVQEWYVSKTPSLKISSQNKYRQLIEKHILPDLGHLKTCEITDHVLLTFLITQKQKGDLRSKGQGLSDSSMKTITYILKSVLLYCQKQGYIDRKISIDTDFSINIPLLLAIKQNRFEYVRDCFHAAVRQALPFAAEIAFLLLSNQECQENVIRDFACFQVSQIRQDVFLNQLAVFIL